MSTVLITGCSGFFGKLAYDYMSEFYDVVGLSRTNSDINVDIMNEIPVFDGNIDYVIHAAGKAHVIPANELEVEQFFKTNYEGTKNICKAIDKLSRKPKAFIFISTVAVYGVDSGYHISEKCSKNGSTPYAKSKILAEEWLQNWALEREIVLGILRLPLIAGNNAPGNLGAMVNGIKTGKYLGIGKGGVQKSVVWVEDVVKIIPKLYEVGGVYNLTDGYHPTFRELEDAISTALNKPKPKRVPYWMASILAKAGDLIGSKFPINSIKLNKITSSLTFCDQKARKELGWNPSKVINKIKLQ